MGLDVVTVIKDWKLEASSVLKTGGWQIRKGQWGSFLEISFANIPLPKKKKQKKERKKKCSVYTYMHTQTHTDLLWILEGDYSLQRLDSKIPTTDTNLFKLYNYMTDLPSILNLKNRKKKDWNKENSALGNSLSITRTRHLTHQRPGISWARRAWKNS